MRKIILFLLVVAVLLSGGVYVFSRKAPGLLRDAIQRAINKTVKIDAIDYRFPWTFELKGFQILETREPFIGEVCFAVDKVLLDVSPMSLSRNRLIIDSVDVAGARVAVRKRGDKLFHALADAMATPEAALVQEKGTASTAHSQLPLVIHRFHLTQSRFQMIDYDVQEKGFVTELDQIEADLKNVAFPPEDSKTTYKIDARLPQGRQQRAAELHVSGWTVFSDYDTDALLNVSDLSVPYFSPYYGEVTGAVIDDGKLSGRSALRIHHGILTADVDLEAAGLYFRSYEDGDQLFGLKADEILSFLKDSAGRLQFHIVLQWDLSDRSIDKRAVIRRAIEQSLQKTLLGNVGDILEKTLQKFSNPDGEPGKAGKSADWHEALKKVKKLLQ